MIVKTFTVSLVKVALQIIVFLERGFYKAKFYCDSYFSSRIKLHNSNSAQDLAYIIFCELRKLCYIETSRQYLCITHVFGVHLDSLK